MSVYLDTTILGRLANASDVQYGVALRAVVELHRRGELLLVSPQVLIEFRSVATRPVIANGLGLSAVDTDRLTAMFESRFSVLDETPSIYSIWKFIVNSLGVVGKQVHDARHVAVCQVHGMAQVMTFNVNHFVRLATAVPGLTVIHPNQV